MAKLTRKQKRKALAALLEELYLVEARTGEGVASIAARGLEDPESLTLDEIQTVCASALRQHQED